MRMLTAIMMVEISFVWSLFWCSPPGATLKADISYLFLINHPRFRLAYAVRAKNIVNKAGFCWMVFVVADRCDAVDGPEILHQLMLVVSPILYKVLAPSQVVQDFWTINSGFHWHLPGNHWALQWTDLNLYSVAEVYWSSGLLGLEDVWLLITY